MPRRATAKPIDQRGARGDPHQPRREPLRRGRRRHRQDDLARRADRRDPRERRTPTVDSSSVITFTRGAAAELSARVREGLEQAAASEADADARARAARRSALRPPPRPDRDDPRLRAQPAARAPGRGRARPRVPACSATSRRTSASTRPIDDWLAELLAERAPEVETRRSTSASDLDELEQAAAHRPRTATCCRSAVSEAEPGDAAEVVDWLERARAELEAIAEPLQQRGGPGARADRRRLLDFGERLRDRGHDRRRARAARRPRDARA